MNEIRLIKKADMPAYFRAKHQGALNRVFDSKDYCKPCSLKLHNCNHIDKIFICTAAKMHCENLCKGFVPNRQGKCQFQVDGPYRAECLKGQRL